MKCFFAIPPQFVPDARILTDAYSAELRVLSARVVELADQLHGFAESCSSSVLKIDDEDWMEACREMKQQGEQALAGEVFWSAEEVRRAQVAMKGTELGSPTSLSIVESWLAKQAARGRAVVLLTR